MQKLIITSLVLSSFNAEVLANPPSSVELSEMLVTASRTEVPHSELSAAATVFTRQDIDRLQVKSLPELLSGSTGIDITQNGGIGTISSIFMRGTNSDHVLVLIDGIKVGSASAGTTPFEFVPIDQIDRVEIIRGPQSSLYGSEALGGVIQIFTRKTEGSTKPKVMLSTGGGSYDTYRASGLVSGEWQNSWYSLGASSLGSAGINARQPIPGPYGFSQPDRDGFQNTAMNARAGHRFANDAEVEASFMRAQGDIAYDANFGGDHSNFITQVVGLSAKTKLLNNLLSSLRLGQSRDENTSFLPDNAFYSRFNTTRWNASWLNDFSLTPSDKIILGSDYRLDEIDSSTQFTKTSRYDVGVFAEYRGQFWQRHFVNSSVRWDTNEAVGEYVTGSVGWRANWEYGLSTFANFGNAFKAPSFNDLYFPDYGNPHLKPEESTSFEAGLAGKYPWLQWELRAYHTNIDNLISPVPDKNFNYMAQNLGRAQIDGLEAEIATQILGWQSKLNMNILSPVSRDSNTRLPRRADQTLSFDVSRSIADVDVGAKLLAQDHRFDNAQNTIKVGGYVTVDLRAAYHLNKNWTLSAKLNNLLDKEYHTVNTYNTPGRNFFFTIQYSN